MPAKQIISNLHAAVAPADLKPHLFFYITGEQTHPLAAGASSRDL